MKFELALLTFVLSFSSLSTPAFAQFKNCLFYCSNDFNGDYREESGGLVLKRDSYNDIVDFRVTNNNSYQVTIKLRYKASNVFQTDPNLLDEHGENKGYEYNSYLAIPPKSSIVLPRVTQVGKRIFSRIDDLPQYEYILPVNITF